MLFSVTLTSPGTLDVKDRQTMKQLTVYAKDDRTDACVALFNVYVTNGKTLVRALDARREPVARRMAAALNAARKCGIQLEPVGEECVQLDCDEAEPMGVGAVATDGRSGRGGTWRP